MKRIPIIIIIILMFFSCLERHENYDDMRQLLQSTTEQTKAGTLFTTDSITKYLTDFFDNHGTDEERALAYYLYGCSLVDLGQAPEGLKAYYTALESIDTTKSDCNYNLLKDIYGQMSLIFSNQNLPQDEIWALNHYIENVKKTSDESEYLYAKFRLVSPYFLLNEIDSVLYVCQESYKALKYIGDNQKAAMVLCPTIYIYTERNQMDLAKQSMEIVEKESGWFDENGNIEEGRESYYYTKGFYELAVNQLDSAEIYFRKAIKYGYLSEGYRGLLSVYRKEDHVDSVYHFSLLYEAAQDTLHNQMRTNAIHQMSALYNYNKSQEEAERERARSRKLKMYITFFTIVFVLSTGFALRTYQKYQKKRKRELFKLNKKLEQSINARSEILMELQMLKSKDYESVIAAKEAKEIELTEIIKQLQEQKGVSNDTLTANVDVFIESKIAQLFIRKSNNQTERCQASEAEWNLLVHQFSKNLPVMYKSFADNGPLSQLEQRVCMLYILGIPEKNFTLILENSSAALTNAKARANLKLFGKKEARSLKTNLFQVQNMS